MSFIEENPLLNTESESSPPTPPVGTRGLFPKEDGWYDIDNEGNEHKLANTEDVAIEKIKVNGEEQQITNKEVDISIPTKISDLENDTELQGGKDGVSPTVSFKSNDNGYTMTVTDVEGEKSIDILNGENGYTPKKGEDYWTDEEISELLDPKADKKDIVLTPGAGDKSAQQLLDDKINFNLENNPNKTEVLGLVPGLLKGKDIKKTDGEPSLGAFGVSSVSLNGKSQAYGKRSVSEGSGTVAVGQNAHAEGIDCIALGNDSHAEGIGTSAIGDFTHTEGRSTKAYHETAHAEGDTTVARGIAAHTEGYHTQTGATYIDEESGKTIWVDGTGKYAHAEGESTIAIGSASHAEGKGTVSSGSYSHAQGVGTSALGVGSTSIGNGTKSVGHYTLARGRYNLLDDSTLSGGLGKFVDVVGNGSGEDEYDEDGNLIKQNRSNAYTLDWKGNGWFAGDVTIHDSDGNEYKLSENLATAPIEAGEGTGSIEQRKDSSESWVINQDNDENYGGRYIDFVTGSILGEIKNTDGNNIKGQISDSVNLTIGAFGQKSTMWNGESQTVGSKSHAEGSRTIAFENNSHAEGNVTIASGINSHAEGSLSIADGNNSHAENNLTVAAGESSHAEGLRSMAVGSWSHAEGVDTVAEGKGTHVEGHRTESSVTSEYAHAEGVGTNVGGQGSHAEGMYSVASKDSAHAEGRSTESNGEASHSEGYDTEARGTGSHAEGLQTKAVGNHSHAQGNLSIANGEGSSSMGLHTIANANYTTVRGRYNKEDIHKDGVNEDGKPTQIYGKYADVVGNGRSDEERSNAYTLDWDGNAEFAGIVKTKGKEVATQEVVQELQRNADYNYANAVRTTKTGRDITIDDLSPLSHTVDIVVTPNDDAGVNLIEYPYPEHKNEHLTFIVNKDGSIHILGKTVYAEVFVLKTNFKMDSGFKYHIEANTDIAQLSGSEDVKVYFYFRPSNSGTNALDIQWKSDKEVDLSKATYYCGEDMSGDIKISVMPDVEIDMMINPVITRIASPEVVINGVNQGSCTNISHTTNSGDTNLRVYTSPASFDVECTYNRDINKVIEMFNKLNIENGEGVNSIQQKNTNKTWMPNYDVYDIIAGEEVPPEDREPLPVGAGGEGATSLGVETTAGEKGALSTGVNTIAVGEGTFSGGIDTLSIGKATSATGWGTVAKGLAQSVRGYFNAIEEGYLDIVGNGMIDEVVDENDVLHEVAIRRNAYTLDYKGNGWFAGDVTIHDSDGNEYKLSESLPGKWELVAEYTHSGNRIIQPTALDKTTGYFTCENHGLSEGDQLMTLENLDYLTTTSAYIPYELYERANYDDNRMFISLKTVSVIDENTFAFLSTDGTILTYPAAQNSGVNVTKFYFETIDGGKFARFNNLNLDMREYDVKIIANNPHIRVSFVINNITSAYQTTNSYGHAGGLGNAFHTTPVCGVSSQGRTILEFDGKRLIADLRNTTRWVKKSTPLSVVPVNDSAFYNVFTTSGNEAFCENPIINTLEINTYWNSLYMRNGGCIEIWKRRK